MKIPAGRKNREAYHAAAFCGRRKIPVQSGGDDSGEKQLFGGCGLRRGRGLGLPFVGELRRRDIGHYDAQNGRHHGAEKHAGAGRPDPRFAADGQVRGGRQGAGIGQRGQRLFNQALCRQGTAGPHPRHDPQPERAYRLPAARGEYNPGQRHLYPVLPKRQLPPGQ